MSFTYKGLEATYTRHRITDEELERQLERLRRQTPQVVPVTGRGAENGDTVELDYAGFCDGEPFAGGTAEHQTLVLGSGTFIPGFEEQLLGCRPGDKVTVLVTSPGPTTPSTWRERRRSFAAPSTPSPGRAPTSWGTNLPGPWAWAVWRSCGGSCAKASRTTPTSGGGWTWRTGCSARPRTPWTSSPPRRRLIRRWRSR